MAAPRTNSTTLMPHGLAGSPFRRRLRPFAIPQSVRSSSACSRASRSGAESRSYGCIHSSNSPGGSMHRRPDSTTRPIPRTQPYDPLCGSAAGTRTGSRPGRKRRAGGVDGSNAAVGPRPSPQRRPRPDDAKSATAGDFHVHLRSIRQIALQAGNVAERPELSVQRPLQIADSPARESAPNHGNTDHRIVKRGHVGACVNGQPTATVLIPRHRADLPRAGCSGGRRDEWHSIPVLGRGSQIPVYPMSHLHARTKRVWRAAASSTAARPAWNGASGHQARLGSASK